MPPTTDRREPTVRHSIRLVLLDEHDRLLLFSGTDEADGRTFWYPIGGGTEDGETPQQTAAREAHEETGLTDLVVGPEVWRRRAYATWGGTTYDCRERYFLARVPAFDIDTSGFTEVERATVTGHRWWTLADLAANPDRVVPGDLLTRLADLLLKGPPAEPITLDA
ncbi:NUDIX domain-containing protein [Nocardia sp. NPDC050718]|uniref:NUDIX hydrolase n=1 Tax=Nocardia sp. NPDC050718 TaxID=3155788 RepID=UPI003405AAEA